MLKGNAAIKLKGKIQTQEPISWFWKNLQNGGFRKKIQYGTHPTETKKYHNILLK
jgi:hypothetical protein